MSNINKNKILDIDTFLIFILPIIALLILVLFEARYSLPILGLIIAISLYNVIVYRNRNIFGFNGIAILSWPSVVFLSYTLIIAIPSVYLTITKTESIRWYFYASILTFYILYPLGLLLANKKNEIINSKIIGIRENILSKTSLDNTVYKICILMLSFSFIIMLLYLYRVPFLPIIQLIKTPGESTLLTNMRAESMKLLNVSFIEKYLFAWLREVIFPIGITASFALALLYRKSKYIFLFLLFFISGLVNNSLTLTKSPVAAIFLCISAVYFLWKRKITPRLALIATVVMFSFPALMYMFIAPEDSPMRDIANVAVMILFRLFIVPAEALYQYFLIFPSIHGFLYGRSSKIFSWIYDDGLFNAPNYVAKIWWDEPFTHGNANAIYIGNFWADFGLIGVFLSTIFIGYFIHTLYYYLVNVSDYKRNIIYIIFTAGLMPVMTFSFISSNFTTLLLTRGLLIILILLKVFYDYLQYKQKRGVEGILVETNFSIR